MRLPCDIFQLCWIASLTGTVTRVALSWFTNKAWSQILHHWTIQTWLSAGRRSNVKGRRDDTRGRRQERGPQTAVNHGSSANRGCFIQMTCNLCFIQMTCNDCAISFSRIELEQFPLPMEYRPISNISRTKSQNLNVSGLVLQVSLCNLLKPGVKSRMKM